MSRLLLPLLLAAPAGGVVAQTPEVAPMRVTFLGTGAPPPSRFRMGPSTLVEAGPHKLVFELDEIEAGVRTSYSGPFLLARDLVRIEVGDSVRIVQDAGPAEDRIRILRERSNAAIARQDVPAIVSFLDEEFQLTAGAGWFLRGRSEMGESFARQFAEFEDAVYVRTPESVEASTAAPLAWETGSWVGTWTTPEGPLRTGGRYAASWREVDGEWKIRSELFVTLFCDGEGC